MTLSIRQKGEARSHTVIPSVQALQALYARIIIFPEMKSGSGLLSVQKVFLDTISQVIYIMSASLEDVYKATCLHSFDICS